MMRALALLALVCVSGCDRFGDHPEGFIKVHTASFDKIEVVTFDGYLMATGVWTIDGPDRIAAPINVSTIRCTARDEICRISRAEIITMNGSSTLMDREDIYLIERWDARQVVAVDQGECRRSELRIDIGRDAVTEITDNKPGGNCAGYPIGPVERPRIARLISSDELQAIKRRSAL